MGAGGFDFSMRARCGRVLRGWGGKGVKTVGGLFSSQVSGEEGPGQRRRALPHTNRTLGAVQTFFRGGSWGSRRSKREGSRRPTGQGGPELLYIYIYMYTGLLFRNLQ